LINSLLRNPAEYNKATMHWCLILLVLSEVESQESDIERLESYLDFASPFASGTLRFDKKFCASTVSSAHVL